MKERLFNEERMFVTQLMGYDPRCSWKTIYKKLMEKIPPLGEVYSDRAMELLFVVRECAYYENIGEWPRDEWDIRKIFHKLINYWFDQYYNYLCRKVDANLYIKYLRK